MSLPSGYKRLEYIQSSGTQRIDTGIKPNQDTRVIMDVLVLDSQTVEGHLCSVTGIYYYVVSFNPTISTWWRTRYGSSNLATFSASINNRGRLTIDKNKNVTTILGESITLAESTFQMSLDMPLLCRNANGKYNAYISARLYSCQIYDNGTLVRDYIPCQTTSGEIGLWDDVNSVFYGNAGTGTFMAGPVIAIAAAASEITELEYIQSSGTQYIDTVFVPNQDTTAEVTFETTQSYDCGIAASDLAWTSNDFGIWGNCVAYGTQTYSNVVFYGIGKVTARLDRNKLYKNGELIWTASAATFSCPSNLTLMALNRNGTIQEKTAGNWYSSKIYDNGTIIRDYIAAKLSDGTVGLYDKLHGLLYINVGSGAFTAGPEVQKAPSAPSGFTALRLTDTAVQLNWAASDGATGYNLYRDGILIATLTDTSYTDVIQPFTPYVYALTAYNENGDGYAAELVVFLSPDNPILWLVTDRTQEDVTARNSKGVYQAVDLNRVGAAVEYLQKRLFAAGVLADVSPRTDWTDSMWISAGEARVYLDTVKAMRAALAMPKGTPTAPDDMEKLTYAEANHIEMFLVILDALLTDMVFAYRHCGVTTCGMGGLIL